MTAAWGHRRLLAMAVAVGIALWFASSAIRVGVSDHLVRSDPAAAAEWMARNPFAWQRLSAARLEQGDPGEARTHAYRAIALRPLEPRAYRLLGAALEAEGKLAEAAAAHRAAIGVAPNESRSHLWLAGQLLAAQDYPQALVHVDRALRAQPDLAESVLGPLLAGLHIPGFRESLTTLIADRPPWRRTLLVRLAGDEHPIEGVDRFMRAVASKSPFEFDEIAAWLARLEREQAWDSFVHHAGRLAAQPDGQVRDERLVDGSFAGPFRSQGFGWRISRAPGAVTASTRPTRRDARGTALSVRFNGQRMRFEHVAQLVVLEPGSYRFTGESMARMLRVRQGLRWSVRCFEDYRLIAEGPRLQGSTDWQAWSVVIDVPPDCRAQWVRLEQVVDSPQDEWIGGVVQYRGLSIRQLDGPIGTGEAGALSQSVEEQPVGRASDGSQRESIASND